MVEEVALKQLEGEAIFESVWDLNVEDEVLSVVVVQTLLHNIEIIAFLEVEVFSKVYLALMVDIVVFILFNELEEEVGERDLGLEEQMLYWCMKILEVEELFDLEEVAQILSFEFSLLRLLMAV